MEQNSSMNLLSASYKNIETDNILLLNQDISEGDRILLVEKPEEDEGKGDKELIDENKSEIKMNNSSSVSSKKINDLFDSNAHMERTDYNFNQKKIPTIKNILKQSTKKNIIKREESPIKKYKTVKFSLPKWDQDLNLERKCGKSFNNNKDNSSLRSKSSSNSEQSEAEAQERKISDNGESKIYNFDFQNHSINGTDNEISLNYPIISSRRSNLTKKSFKQSQISNILQNTKNLILNSSLLKNSSKFINTHQNQRSRTNNSDDSEDDQIFILNNSPREENIESGPADDEKINNMENENNFLSDTINDFIAKEKDNLQFRSLLKINHSVNMDKQNDHSEIPSTFRRNFKRSNNKRAIHKIAHQMKMKNIVTKVSAKEKFKIVFKKLRIILLFMYMIKRVKFYGLKILREDIKTEIERLGKLKLLKRRPENVLVKAKTTLINDKIVDKKTDLQLLVPEAKGPKCNYIKYFIINPEKPFMNYWNIVLAVLIVYTATVVPYRTSFNDPPEFPSAWYFIELIVDILFTIDFILNCFCGYYNYKNDLVMQWDGILLNYLKGWMAMDLISILPFQYFLQSENNSRKIGVTVSYLARLVKLFRLLKLFRIFRLMRLFRQNKYIRKYVKLIKLNGNVKRIIVGLFIFVVVVHIFSCIWYFFAKLQNFDPGTWVFRSNLLDENQNPGMMYFNSLYFTLSIMATLGYGDITAGTNIEKFLVIVLMIFGSVFISIIISNLVGAISHYDTYDSLQQEKINILNKFAYRNKLKNDLYLKIKKIFEDNSLNDLIIDQDTLFKDLPYYLQVEIILHIQERNIKDIFYFRDRNPNFVIEVIQHWTTAYYQKNDFIYFIDDKPQDVYFITKGLASYIDDKGNSLTKFANGSILGEIEIILGINKRFLNLRAEDNCNMNKVSAVVFKQILTKFSNEFTSSMKSVKIKYKKYKDIMVNLEKNQAMDEKVKKECDTYKTTSSYLNHIKRLKRLNPAAKIELDSVESSVSNKLMRSGSELSKISEESNDKSGATNKKWDKQTYIHQNNNELLLLSNNQNNNNINPEVNNTNANRLSLQTVNPQNQINGSLIQPYFDILDAVLNNPRDKHRNQIATESEKRKLIEIVKTFDRFLDFLDINFENFANLKYQVYGILDSSREQTQKVEEVDRRIKTIEKNQEIIEANINHIY